MLLIRRMISSINPIHSNSKAERTPSAVSFTGHYGFERILTDSISINRLVLQTEFFREPKTLTIVSDYIINLAKHRKVRVLSCGCSTGEEAVSTSMLTEAVKDNVEIIGIDLSKSSIESAKRGIYSMLGTKYERFQDEFLIDSSDVIPLNKSYYLDLFQKYFEKYKPKGIKEKIQSFIQRIKLSIFQEKVNFKQYKLKPGMATNCTFIEGDVTNLKNIIQDNADVILFRNVLYHMVCASTVDIRRVPLKNHAEIVNQIISNFKKKLNRGGILVFGESEKEQSNIDPKTLSKIMEANGFKVYNDKRDKIGNIWVLKN